MTTTNYTIQNPLNTLVWKDTAVTNTKVQPASATTNISHMEFDNSANTAVTYYKMWAAASGSVSLGVTEPDFIIKIAGGTKQYMTIPTKMQFANNLTYIATSVLANDASQSAPANAVGLTLIYS